MENNTPQPEFIRVPKQFYTDLIKDRTELQQTVIYSTDVILIFIEMLGGKLPTSKKDIIMLLPKLPKLIESLSDEKKQAYLQEAFKNILEAALKYTTEKQLQKLTAMDLLPLPENL